MPKTTKSGKVNQDELPSTLERSDRKAQRAYAKVHDSAAEQYGDEERAITGNRRSTTDRPTLRQRVAMAPTGLPPAASMPTRRRSTCTSSPPGWRSRDDPR